MGHLQACGWLHTAVGIIKCKENAITSGWNNQMSDALLTLMIVESIERAAHENPVDNSSLALGVLLERDGACLLQPTNNARHINRAELDTVASKKITFAH